MNRVLVTGASGLIGTRTLIPLLARGFEVHALARQSGPALDGVTWHTADLLSAGMPTAVIERVHPTHLLHLAWMTAHGRFWTDPDNLRWVSATLELARAFVDAGGRRLVVAGTSAEYGASTEPCDEHTTAIAPTTLYGTAKAATHDVLRAYVDTCGVQLVWGRVFLLYGDEEPAARLVPSVIDALLAGQPAECTHGEQLRDLMHVTDVASAFVALLDSNVTGPVNIGTGQPLRLRDVVMEIAHQLGRADLVRLGARTAPPGEPAMLVPRIDRLTKVVGTASRVSLPAGIEATIAFRRARRAR